MPRLQDLRRVLRRDVLALCAVVFSADVLSGILSPTFSLYAKQLGASLTLVGALSSTVGLTTLCVSLPIGMLSDRIGRKIVLTTGMLLFSLAALSFALAPNAYLLFPGRVFIGLAMICTFYLAAAYIGDVVSPEDRALALGLYATSMGFGFAVGPLAGAAIAGRYGIATSYLFASAVAFAGALVATLGLRAVSVPRATAAPAMRGMAWADTWRLLRSRHLFALSLSNLLIHVSFGGAVANFFPVYVAQLGAAQVAINSMFALRAFGSTATRLPTGALTSRVPSRWVMYVALTLVMVVQFSMGRAQTTALMSLLLLLEGVSYGVFLTAGQISVAETCTPTTRGAAVGIYSTAASLGTMVSSVLLGMAADRWGVQTVFRLSGVAILLGLAVVGHLYMEKKSGQRVADVSVGTGNTR